MAVYTKFSKDDIESILSNYSIGSLNLFEGISEGIENTNYFLLVDNKKYILTIYEKRVKEEDLPFFSKLMHWGKKLPNEAIKKCKKIGISSGASAPEQLVQNLINEIKKDCNVFIEEVLVAEEKVVFKLPKELN